MPTPQRFARGLTNVSSQNTMGQLIIPDPTSTITFMDDFLKFAPGDWFITEIGTGATAGSITLTDATNGILAVTPHNADNDSIFMQWKGTANISTASEQWTIEAAKKLWFKARLKIEDTGDSDFHIGLQSADTTPLTSPADRVVFHSDDGDDNLDFSIYASSASGLADTALVTLVDDTWFTVGFYVSGGTMTYYHNDVIIGTSTVTFPTNEMAITMGIRNGSASARTMSIDYVACIKER